MRFLLELRQRIRSLLRRGEAESALDEELQFHFDHLVEEKVAEGLAPGEAKRAARLELGFPAQIAEECRDSWGLRAVDEFSRDLRLALRGMAANPGFAVIVATTLALGIGVNTAIFSLADAVLLEALPVPSPDELLVVKRQDKATGRRPGNFSYPLYNGLRETENVRLFAAGYPGESEVTFEAGGSPERIRIQSVTDEFFSILGVQPQLGRLLGVDEEVVPGAYPYAVLSDRFWRRRFAAAPNVLGRSFQLNDSVFTIIGVGPHGFESIAPGTTADVWLPIAMQEQIAPGSSRMFEQYGANWITVMGRRANGVSHEEATAALDLAYARLEASLIEQGSPDARRLTSQTLSVEPGRSGLDVVRRQYATPLRILMGVALLVLLLACANVAGLMLARAAQRTDETVVRAALGASRGRLVRQWLTESLLLAAIGGVAGVLVALIAGPALVAVASIDASLVVDTGLDWRLLAIAVAASACTAIVFGIGPALAAGRADARGALNGVGRRSTESKQRTRIRSGLAATQVAVSVVLVFSAGLLLQSIGNLRNAERGFSSSNLLSLRTEALGADYAFAHGTQPTEAERRARQERLSHLTDRLVRRVEATPGVRRAVVAQCGFYAGCEATAGNQIIVDGEIRETDRQIRLGKATAGFVDALGMRLPAGRDFNETDRPGTRRVVILNATAAGMFFPGERAVGRTFLWKGGKTAMEVVGVVADADHDGPRTETPPFVYSPFAQQPSPVLTLMVRTDGPPGALTQAVRSAIAEVDQSLNVRAVTTISAGLDSTIRKELMLGRLTTAFGALALLLTAVGLVGVLGYSVARRTKEFGVRMALGARRGQIVAGVVRQTTALIAAGLVVGLLGAWVAVRSIESLLFGVEPTDSRAIVAASAVAILLGVLSAAFPARRAASVDPAVALRWE